MVIDLRYRTADEVLQALAPHTAGRAVSLSATEDRLLLRGPTRDLGVLIDLIFAIDIPTRQFWVTTAVDHNPPSADDSGPYGLPPLAEHFATAQRNAGQRAIRPALSSTDHWRTGHRPFQRVMVQEGEWASFGVHAYPAAPARPARLQVTPQLEVTALIPPPSRTDQPVSGFRVRPRLTGEQVRLEIAMLDSPAHRYAPAPWLRSLATSLTARVGEWLLIWAADSAEAPEATADSIARTRGGGLPSIWIRIDLANDHGARRATPDHETSPRP